MSNTHHSDDASLETVATNLFEHFLNASDRRMDVWGSYRPRVFVASLLSLLTAIFTFNLGYLILGKAFDSVHTLSVVSAIVLLSAIYTFYRLGGKFSIAVKAFMLVNSAILYGFIVLTGGFESPIISLILFLPFLGFLFERRRTGFVWALIGIISYLIFYVLYQQGTNMPQILDAQYRDVAQIFGWILLCIGLIVSLYVYGKANENTALQLTQKYEAYSRAADLDAKTGLLNITAFERLMEKLQRSEFQKTHGLMLVKFFNLEETLKDLSREEKAEFWKNLGTECVRMGGKRCEVVLLNDHEAVYVMQNMQSTSALYNIGRSVYSHFKRSFRVNGERLPVSVRCGIAIFPEHGTSTKQLINNCENALDKSDEINPCQIIQ